jgi:hypothetical protein
MKYKQQQKKKPHKESMKQKAGSLKKQTRMTEPWQT